MSIDLTKLTPAPWEAGREECPAVYGPNGWDKDEPLFEPYVGTEADSQFCAIARNAFDVMVRRGWTAERISSGEWSVMFRNGDISWRFSNATRNSYPDPFTALVAADAWYKANVEGNP